MGRISLLAGKYSEIHRFPVPTTEFRIERTISIKTLQPNSLRHGTGDQMGCSRELNQRIRDAFRRIREHRAAPPARCRGRSVGCPAKSFQVAHHRAGKLRICLILPKDKENDASRRTMPVAPPDTPEAFGEVGLLRPRRSFQTPGGLLGRTHVPDAGGRERELVRHRPERGQSIGDGVGH